MAAAPVSFPRRTLAAAILAPATRAIILPLLPLLVPVVPEDNPLLVTAAAVVVLGARAVEAHPEDRSRFIDVRRRSLIDKRGKMKGGLWHPRERPEVFSRTQPPPSLFRSRSLSFSVSLSLELFDSFLVSASSND